MERTTWTDERLDDMSRRMDAGFAAVQADVRELRGDLRSEIGGLRTEMRDEIGGLRSELSGEIGGLRTELRNELGAFRLTILRVGGGIMVGLVGVIAAVVTSGP